MVRELSGDNQYGLVYSTWKNSVDLSAYEAGRIFCTDFEVPNNVTNESYSRGSDAEIIYSYMVN